MTAVQDFHVDLMHVLYVYSRVMGGEGIITKYSRGQVHVCICGISLTSVKHVHACALMIEVHADMYVYIYVVHGYIYRCN